MPVYDAPVKFVQRGDSKTDGRAFKVLQPRDVGKHLVVVDTEDPVDRRTSSKYGGSNAGGNIMLTNKADVSAALEKSCDRFQTHSVGKHPRTNSTSPPFLFGCNNPFAVGDTLTVPLKDTTADGCLAKSVAIIILC